MYDEPNVGLVDAHTERNRSAHDQRVVTHPLLLLAVPLGHSKVGVVVVGADSAALTIPYSSGRNHASSGQRTHLQRIRHALGITLCQAVHDSRVALVVLGDELGRQFQRIGALGKHDVEQVGPEIRRMQTHGRMANIKVLENIVLRLERGCCSHTQQRQVGKCLSQQIEFLLAFASEHPTSRAQGRIELTQAAYTVIRAEIVAPFADAMRFVDDEPRQLAVVFQCAQCSKKLQRGHASNTYNASERKHKQFVPLCSCVHARAWRTQSCTCLLRYLLHYMSEVVLGAAHSLPRQVCAVPRYTADAEEPIEPINAMHGMPSRSSFFTCI